MTMPAISRLAAASYLVAMHDTVEGRFVGTFSLFCDLSLQNDDHGLMIAAEEAAVAIETDFRHPGVSFDYNADGAVTAIDCEPAFPDDNLAMLAAEIALLPQFEDRHLIIGAAALMLVKDTTAENLADRVSDFRKGRINFEALGLAGSDSQPPL